MNFYYHCVIIEACRAGVKLVILYLSGCSITRTYVMCADIVL